MSLSDYIKRVEYSWDGTTVEEYISNKEVRETNEKGPCVIKSLGTIPGLKKTIAARKSGESFEYSSHSTYVPQGVCVAGQYILLTAYDSDENHGLSVIYVVKAENKSYVTTIILPFDSHVGGIAFDSKNQYIWVANKKSVAGFPYSDLEEIVNEHNKDTAKAYGAYQLLSVPKSYATDDTASYLTFFDNLIWVGTFNEEDVSNIYAYDIDLKQSEMKAVYYMEAPAKAQGMTFNKDAETVYLAVSCSYGNHPSEIRIYKPNYGTPKEVPGESYTKIIKNNAVVVHTIACRAEEMQVSGANLYIVFESGAKKYIQKSDILIDKFLALDVKKFFEC